MVPFAWGVEEGKKEAKVSPLKMENLKDEGKERKNVEEPNRASPSQPPINKEAKSSLIFELTHELAVDRLWVSKKKKKTKKQGSNFFLGQIRKNGFNRKTTKARRYKNGFKTPFWSFHSQSFIER